MPTFYNENLDFIARTPDFLRIFSPLFLMIVFINFFFFGKSGSLIRQKLGIRSLIKTLKNDTIKPPTSNRFLCVLLISTASLNGENEMQTFNFHDTRIHWTPVIRNGLTTLVLS